MKEKKLFTSFILIIISTVLAGSIFSQSVSRPDRGNGGNAPYESSNIENVNLQNGNLGLSIPLASLPPIAGNKLGFSVNAYYNSKIWDTYLEERSNNIPGEIELYNVSIPRVSQQGGWRIGGGYGIDVELASDDYTRWSGHSQGTDPDYTLRVQNQWQKRFLITPDGSRHELRPLGYSTFWGSNSFYYGYYKDTPTSVNAPVTYYSIDSSYIRVTMYPNGSQLLWEVSIPDGTKIRQYQDYQRIEDTNSNKIKIFSDSQGTHYQDEQTSREIRVQGNQVWYQTVGGSWVSIDIVMGTTSVRGKFNEFTVPNRCNQNELFFEDLSVIREISFPQTEATKPRAKMTFSYNSDEVDPVSVPYTNASCIYGAASYQNPSRGLGELKEVVMTSGAVYKYEYVLDNNHITQQAGADGNAASNAISKKTVLHDNQTDVWNYSIGSISAQVTNPDGSTNNLTSYYHSPNDASTRGGANGLGGLVYREDKSNKVRIERRWARQVFTGANDAYYLSKVVFNPVVTEEYTSLLDDSGNPVLMSAKKFQYDYNGNLTQTINYDWFSDVNSVSRDISGIPLGVPSNTPILRTTNTSYHSSPASPGSSDVYAKTSNSILNAVMETSVGSSATRLSYDGLAYGTPPTKGNVTNISVFNDTNGQWITSTIGYDPINGNVTSTTDPKGYTTQIFYEDLTHAMPTRTIVDPLNGTGQQISTATYDFSTGAPLTRTDINGNVSSIDYTNLLLGAVDPFARAGAVYSPYIILDRASKRQTVKTYYEDNARRTRVEADLFNEGDALAKSRESRDQLGRTVLSEKNENGASNYTISSQTIYNSPQNHVVMTSNPRRSTASTTDGWTLGKTDILGRVIETATFSGTAQPSNFANLGANANWTGSVFSTYSANTTTVTDQTGKQRRSVINALGQLTRVDEPDALAGNLDAGGVPVQSTGYVYDVLGNLTTVNQGVQTRTFQYDSLSRLKQATNPELGNTVNGTYVPGTISYTYDADGNLQTKRDPRGIKTIYDYDGLNRVKNKCYRVVGSGALGATTCAGAAGEPLEPNTPDVGYTYDNLTNAKGRLTQVTNGFSTTDYTGFDVFGRATSSQQTTDNAAYPAMAYTYNLSGALATETYPSGRVVKNVFDNSGNLAIAQSKKNSTAGYWDYADSFSYTAAGAVSSMQLGNGKWESTAFNSRLQPTQIALGTVQNGTDNLKLNFDYGSTQNNGNVVSQQITVPTESRGGNTYNGFTATQTYTYDYLNRLKSATENINGNPTPNWKQTFLYDRYGNRNFDLTNGNTTVPDPNCATAICNPSVDAANNRFTTGQGYAYDLDGNVISDATGKSFTYDGENKQTKVQNGSTVIGNYYYDGDGKRVKKIAGAETTIFVYDVGGKMVAEYSTTVASQQNAKVSYLTNDALGSPRITTDANGGVTSRRDFMPFGEEVARASYGTDTVRQKFTSYERDNESGLDFAKARMHNYNHGRFTSPDPLLASGKAANPQTWNRYAYVLNNPLNLIDPTGKSPSTHIDEGGRVITVIEDNDKGVYQHKNNADGKSPTEYMIKKRQQNQGSSAGGTKIGETHFWDDFRKHDVAGNIQQGTAQGARIVTDGSLNFNQIINDLNQKAKNMTLSGVMAKSKHGEDFDIKTKAIYGENTGGLLNGKFVTARSAGNFLAGLNGATVSTISYVTDYLSLDAYMRVAGEYQTTDKMDIPTAAGLRTGAINPTVNVAPFYGESRFSGIYIINGFNYGESTR